MGREHRGLGPSLRVGEGLEELKSSGFGRRGGDICGEPWGPNQASGWQGEQTVLTLAVPHCLTLPQEWPIAGVLFCKRLVVFWGHRNKAGRRSLGRQELSHLWEVVTHLGASSSLSFLVHFHMVSVSLSFSVSTYLCP